MNRHDVKNHFQQMLQGNLDASRELDGYLLIMGQKAATGDPLARSELEELVYSVTTDCVEKRLRRDYPDLIDRHSTASVVHQAWLRLLGTESTPLTDLRSLCLRIMHLVKYALLDITKSQRLWDARHHKPTSHDEVDGPEAHSISVNQIADGISHDPSRLAMWTEFHDRVASLPEQCREVFKLSYYLNMTRAAIAQRLAITEYEVRVLLLDAKQMLAEIVPIA